MLVGVPEKELEKRKSLCTPDQLEQISVPSPLTVTARDSWKRSAVRRAIDDAGSSTKDIDGAVQIIRRAEELAGHAA